MRRIITSLPTLVTFLTLSLASYCVSAQDDVGIAAITQPSGTVCRGNANIEVTLHNYGAVNISTCAIQWSVDGILQTPYSYAGTHTPGSDDSVIIRHYYFNASTYSIVAYSENPN